MNTFTLSPIGIIHTPFSDKYAAPRQPSLSPKPTEGSIELFEGMNFEQALEDLAGFERIWVISWFDRNSTWKPKIQTPRNRKKHGVFATRSPHRPNPIGISVMRLLKIRGRNLRVENPDLLEGTPILDIKPYLPIADSFPDSHAGWLENAGNFLTYYEMQVSELAQAQIDFVKMHSGLDISEIPFRILQNDPFPHSYKRIRKHEEFGFEIAVKSWRLRYGISENTVKIEKIVSGFLPENLLNSELSNPDLENHRKFLEIWR